MALQTIVYLKSKFETGDIPTQQDFYDLLESYLHLSAVTQVTGASTTDVMSQKAVSDALAALGGGVIVANTYANIAAMLADQANQTAGKWYMVTNATTDPTVSSGWAIYNKLAPSTANLSNYQKIVEQESMDVALLQIAAAADINTGTDNAKYLTSLGLQGSKYETQYGLRTFVNGTSGTNTYTGNLAPAITTYGSGGLNISIKFTNANTGASTMAINGLAALPLIRPNGNPLQAGDIPAGSTKRVIYDGTSLIVLNPSNLVYLDELRLKSNAAFTLTQKVASYTMAAAEKTILDAGGSLIMESTTGDLTIPLNATTAFTVGHSFGARGFANIVATGGVTATGTNGTLVIPAGRTVVVEKTATDTWLVHNGAPVVSIWTTSDPGISTESTQAQAEAVATGAQAGSTGGLNQGRAPSEIGLYYLIRKIMTLAWTWTVGPVISDATASTLAWFNASKKLVTAVVTDALDYLGISPVSVAVSLVSTTVTLDCATRYSRKWHTLAAHSANFTLTKTNKTLIEGGHYNFMVTGTVIVQLDSDDRMPDDMPGWNLAGKQLTLTSGGTNLHYTIAFQRVVNSTGTYFQMTCSTKTSL